MKLLTAPFDFESSPSHQISSHFNQYSSNGYKPDHSTEQRVRINGSPLFGVNELEEEEEESHFRGGVVPQQDEQVKGYPTGVGELSFISLCPIVEDILVDPLPPPLHFDTPLPLTTPSLSPEVLSIGSTTKTDPFPMYDVDFGLWNFGQIQPPQLQWYPPPSSFPPRTSTSSASTSHAPSAFSHLQARAVAFDQSLQSPLGDSPLILPSHSASPQLSDDLWSPEDPSTAGFDYSGTPLLLDNLGMDQSRGDGLAGMFDPTSIAHHHFRSNSTSGLVSNYTAAASSSPQLPPQLDIRRDSIPVAFSPIMSQRTYDNLFIECTGIATDSLPPLPPSAITIPIPESDNAEPTEEEEEDSDDEMQENESIPPQLDPAPISTRSTRHRPSTSTSLSPVPTRKSTAPPILPLDAPIQTRKYQVSSRTSRKPIPKALQRQREKGYSEEYLESEADRRRRLNTLSARESRKRKTEAIEQQARENVELKEENEELRERVGELEKENECLRRRIGGSEEGGKRFGKRARRE